MKPKEMTDFEDRFQGSEQDIIVVTGANGVSGGKVRSEKFWTASIEIIAWQSLKDDCVIENKVRLCVKTDDKGLKNLQDKLKGDSLVAVRVKTGENEFLLRKILDVPINSEKLEEILANQKKEVTYEDDFFGVFILNRGPNWFEKEMSWLNGKVSFNFDQDTDQSMKAQLKDAKSIFQDQQRWDRHVRDFAASELLETKNDGWLGDEEKELTHNEFASRIVLTGIEMTCDGEFRFWFHDGGIFFGHSIYVSGDIENGACDADMFG